MKINVFAAILNFKRVNKTGTAKFKDAEVLPSKFLLRGSFTESAPLPQSIFAYFIDGVSLFLSSTHSSYSLI